MVAGSCSVDISSIGREMLGLERNFSSSSSQAPADTQSMTNNVATQVLPDYNPSLPTWEIWLDGSRFASTQCVARARRMLATMTSDSSARRYGNRVVELRIVNDRRQQPRQPRQLRAMVQDSERLLAQSHA